MQVEIGLLGGVLIVVGHTDAGDAPIAYTLDTLLSELERMAMECDEVDKEADALALRTVSALLDELVANANLAPIKKAS